MPTYEYRCDDCGAERSVTMTIAKYDEIRVDILDCRECSYYMHRVYHPLPHTMPVEGHYNLSTGSYVSSDRDLREQLKAASDVATARTGIEHDYRPTDYRDKDRFKVDAEGLDATAKFRHDAGLDTGHLNGLT